MNDTTITILTTITLPQDRPSTGSVTAAPSTPPATSPAPYRGPFIGRAIALADFQPSPYDVDLLKLKVTLHSSAAVLWRPSVT